MELFFKGVAVGITVSFLIGPIFFALVDLTISKGWRSGIFYVFGVLLSDVVLIYVVETVLQQFDFDTIKTQIGLFGGVMLLVFGVLTFLAKASVQSVDVKDIKTLFQAFMKGVLINVFNPFVTIWWIAMYTTVSIRYTGFTDKFSFYFGILLMVLLFDILKIRFAYYLKQRLTIDKLIIVKKIAGVCLVVFGAVMIVRVI
jgi:threonine/homoserine/homoserine lactone efflux protein